MKRKGETFAEFLTAAVVFGLIAASMFEFTANQTQILANIRDRDNLMYHAGRFMAVSGDKTRENADYTCDDAKENVSFTFSHSTKILTVRNNNASMQFTLKP